MKRWDGVIALFLAICVLAGAGCTNGKLTRKEAKVKLDKHYTNNALPFGDVEILLVSGTVSDYCHMDHPPLRPVSDQEDYKIYARLRLVTIEPEHATVANVSLTDAAKKAVTSGPYGHRVKTNCDSWQYTLPLTTFAETDVTGIQQEGTNAKVQYRLCRKLTPLGKAVRDLHLSEREAQSSLILGLGDLLEKVADKDSYCGYKNAHLVKYDDGWRME